MFHVPERRPGRALDGTRPMRLLCVISAVAVLLGPMAQGEVLADTGPDPALLSQITRDQVAIRRNSYNYAPAAIRDGAVDHLYWCGGVAGDFILHAQASAAGGPWHAADNPAPNSFDVALEPSHSPERFDGLHTCDPNVLKIGATYFLYYSGEARDGALTAVGVAASADAVHFHRLNDGNPIVTASKTNPSFAESHLTYGVGQPAAVYVRPYVYLSFTDSTGSGVNKGNGAGQFALRSPDPTFSRDVEELTSSGWRPRRPGQHTAEYAFLESFGLDWAYDPPTGLLLTVTDRLAGHVTLLALDPTTLRTLGSGDLDMAWREGPAILTEAGKTTAPRPVCNRIEITVFTAEGASASPASWGSIDSSRGIFSLASLCGQGARHGARKGAAP